jgi:hypothetical protein
VRLSRARYTSSGILRTEVLLTLRATEFEQRHAVLLHQFVIVAAFLTYLADSENVVWRFIKNRSANRVLEHLLFAVATLLVGVAAFVCTRSRVLRSKAVVSGQEQFVRSGFVGEFMYAVGLASLAPLGGSLILIAGEGIRIFRLAQRGSVPSAAESGTLGPSAGAKLRWKGSLRSESFKWGIFLAMAVFSITLRDRLAEVLIGIACLIGFVLMFPAFRDSGASGSS